MSQGKGGGRPADAEALVLAVVSEGRKGIAEIAKVTGKSVSSVKASLLRLKKKGKVAACGKGVYREDGPAVSPPRERHDDDGPIEGVLAVLRKGPAPLRDIRREIGMGTMGTQRLLKRMRDAKMVTMSGMKATSLYQLPGKELTAHRGAKADRFTPAPRGTFVTRHGSENPVVVALLAQRDRAARELDKIDRMLAIAREE